MRFVETPVFTKRVRELLSDDEYRTLQVALVLRPEQGRLIQHGHGLRKVRCAVSGAGKRGGVRVIYHYRSREQMILMLFAYAKSRHADLTSAQTRILANLIRQELE